MIDKCDGCGKLTSKQGLQMMNGMTILFCVSCVGRLVTRHMETLEMPERLIDE